MLNIYVYVMYIVLLSDYGLRPGQSKTPGNTLEMTEIMRFVSSR